MNEWSSGFWRNFKVRYPESDEMYCRMMCVSARLHKAVSEGWGGADIELARESLYRSQCNCGYWHGAFGGIYLPHLRNAVYRELIRADNLIDRAVEHSGDWLESQTADFNFDGQNEVRLTNDQLNLMFLPHKGGMLYELDIKNIAHNLSATMTRRPEAYHRKLARFAGRLAAGEDNNEKQIICKQEGLDRQLQYDAYPRKLLLDLFYDYDTDFESVQKARTGQHGDFVQGDYNAVIRKKTNRMQVLMSREGFAYGQPVRIDKAITLSAGSSAIDIAYRLSGLPEGYKIHFAVEFNFAGMPGGAENRFFHHPFSRSAMPLVQNTLRTYCPLATLDKPLDLTNEHGLALYDDWLGLDVALNVNQPTDFYAFPVGTVNQSDGGFELVHQSVAVQPHWRFAADETGVWSVEMQLKIDTSAARERDLKAHALLKDAAKILVGDIE
ncbi:MAG: DUF1926 domain-containing protein [Planctomycetaceae bacterium]|nr:DUF1926 domain-containing protein [Planctomycetaceae bacterium]